MSDAVFSQILASLNRIEGKVDANHTQISDRLDRHMNEEENEIEALMGTLESYREESDRRHTSLIQSINSYMEKQCEIERAFLHDERGKPDYEGHHDDHKTRKQSSQWWDSMRDRAIGKLVEWGVVVIAAWVLLLIWQGFLKGPMQ